MKHIVLMVLVLIVVGSAALMNPSADEHMELVQTQYETQNPMTGHLGIGYALSKAMSCDNYVVASRCRIGNETITWGAGGHINVRSLDLEEVWEIILKEGPTEVRSRL